MQGTGDLCCGQGNAEAVSSRQSQWKSRNTMQAPISSLNPAMLHDLQESFKGAHTMDNMRLLLSMGIEVSIFLCKYPCQEKTCWLKRLLCTCHMLQTDTFLSPIQHLSVLEATLDCCCWLPYNTVEDVHQAFQFPPLSPAICHPAHPLTCILTPHNHSSLSCT